MNKHIPTTCIDKERSQLHKILAFRFPHSYRIPCLLIGGLLLISMIIFKFSGYNPDVNKDAVRAIMLLFLLVASLSSEPFEDEYTSHLRGQSFIVAFVGSMGYSIIIPLVAFVLDILIVTITGDGETSFYEISAFEVMFMMICFQMLSFELLKRLDRAE